MHPATFTLGQIDAAVPAEMVRTIAARTGIKAIELRTLEALPRRLPGSAVSWAAYSTDGCATYDADTTRGPSGPIIAWTSPGVVKLLP